jgi:hypothetical protein
MIEILAVGIVVVAIVALVLILAAGVLVLLGTVAGLDVYDRDEYEETEPTTLLGVVSPKNHSNSKGNIDV